MGGSGHRLRRPERRGKTPPVWLAWHDVTRILIIVAVAAVFALHPTSVKWRAAFEVGVLYILAQAAFWVRSRRRSPMRRAVLVKIGLDVAFTAAMVPFSGLGESPVLVLFTFPVATAALVVGLRWSLAVATTCLATTALLIGPTAIAAAPEHIGSLVILLYGTAVVTAGINRRNHTARAQARRMARGVTAAARDVERGTDLESVLGILGDLALQVTGAAKGAIVLAGCGADAPRAVWARDLSAVYLAAATATSLASEPFISHHPAADPRLGQLQPRLAGEGVTAVVVLPLYAGGHGAGRMELHFTSRLLDDTVALNMAAPFAQYAGMALQQHRDHRLLIHWSRQLAQAHARAMDQGEPEVMGTVLAQSLRFGRRLLGADLASAAIWDDQGQIEQLVTDGVDKEIPGAADAKGLELLQAVRQADRPLRAVDAGESPGEPPPADLRVPVRGFLGLPIRHLSPRHGALVFANKRLGGGFTLHDEQLAETIVAQLAAVLQVPRFVHEQSARSDALLHLLTQITDAREKAVYGHSTRVAQYARTLAVGLGLDAQTMERTLYGGLLHDVGKIAIPDAILYKPGPLDDGERAVMMSHAAVGARIVAEAGQLATVAPAVRHHHEWWNGHGYPDGCAGAQIPVEARIITVADALDAMTTNRPYRPACSLEEAIERIRRATGSQFDPDVVAVLEQELASMRTTAESVPAISSGHSLAGQHADAQIAAWRVFRKLGERLRAVLDLQALGQVVDSLLAEEMRAVAHSLLVLDANGALLRAVSTHRDTLNLGLGSTLPRGAGLSWAALLADRPLVVDDAESDPRYALPQTGEHHAAVFLPLTSLGGEPQGVLAVYRSRAEPFQDEDVEKLQAIGVAIGEAVAVAQLHEQMRARR